ncbi:unnamed protein product [Ectocarpus sp. CCAP 1310/34]|nr:unnamed protein product [Ectocarpus sp. CCAP 1310/34]
MLDFVLHPSSPDTSGIPVGGEKLRKVMEWVSKREDPIVGELLPDASQTAEEVVAKGLFKDKFTAALLNGIEPEDGGGVGTPFESDGKGDCLLNSVAAFFAKDGGQGVRSAVKTIAVKLRLSVVLFGLIYMGLFLLEQDDISGHGTTTRRMCGKGWRRTGGMWHPTPTTTGTSGRQNARG